MPGESSEYISGLAYHRCGRGPTLVLIHGVGLRAESWYQQMEMLSEHFELIVVDLPGHGGSSSLSVNFDQVSLNDFVESVAQFCSSLECSYYLCGHSLGALISIELAARQRDRVLGLLALNTVFQRSEQALNAVMQRARQLHQSDEIIGIDVTLERWFVQPHTNLMKRYRDQCEAWLRANRKSGYALAYQSFANGSGADEQSLSQIQCPAVFMSGDLDFNSTPVMSERLAQLPSQARSCIVAGAGHMLPLTHPQAVCAELLTLLNSSTRKAEE